MSPDLLLSNVSHFNSTSISGLVRAGHEASGAEWGSVYISICLQKSVMPPGWTTRTFTGFFFLASILSNGQPRPSSPGKMFHHYFLWAGILSPCWCNTNTAGTPAPSFHLVPLVWNHLVPLGEKGWRGGGVVRSREGESSSFTPAQGWCPCLLCVWGTAFALAESAVRRDNRVIKHLKIKLWCLSVIYRQCGNMTKVKWCWKKLHCAFMRQAALYLWSIRAPAVFIIKFRDF